MFFECDAFLDEFFEVVDEGSDDVLDDVFLAALVFGHAGSQVVSEEHSLFVGEFTALIL